MNIAADRNMPLARQAFSTLGTVSILDGRSLTAQDLRDIEMLAIRSTTKITSALLDGTPVRFVGTATIGTDHMDIPMLAERGIQWAYSPGCNARSVAEYITVALLELSVRHGIALHNKTLGVVGVGNVGRLVVQQAEALGMQVLLHDPPRQRALPPDQPDPFSDLDTLLAQSDFVSLHVPLSKTGPDATLHMANAAFFQSMQPHAFFLNAARGPVMDTSALLLAMDQQQIQGAVLDTWANEPTIDRQVLDRVEIGTPHIAGHSYEGKLGGTVMVYEAACRFLGQTPSFDAAAHLPAPPVPFLTAQPAATPEQCLLPLVKSVYNIMGDDHRLRQLLAEDPAASFDALRRQYPIRREFRFTTVDTHALDAQRSTQIAKLGFQTANSRTE